MGAASVVALLDGNACVMKFADTYVSDAASGGRRAANDLYEHIHKLIASKEGEDDHRVLVQIFVNLPRLHTALGPEFDLKSFVRAFNRSAFPMSIVDTGSVTSGDRAAELALKNHLRFLSPMADYIILGGSHDGEYAHAIRQLGMKTRKKIFLITHGTPLAPELEELHLPSVEFQGLFRVRQPAQSQPFAPALETSGSEAKKAQFLKSLALGTALGLVEVGSGELPNEAWIKLNKSPSSDSGSLNVPFLSALLAAQLAQPARAPSPQSLSAPVPDFAPLIDAIRSQPHSRPLFSQIGGILAPLRPKLYLSFDAYARAAQSAGLVNIGKKEGVVGSEWIELQV
ncbi:hypothetical protein RQP46_005137 [Phenoliferia psychrophenolica]